MATDDRIAPGGCRVQTEGGGIDADLESQLDRIVREIVNSESVDEGNTGERRGDGVFAGANDAAA